MKAAIAVLALLCIPAAWAQQSARPAHMPAGVREAASTRQPIEQDLPPPLSGDGSQMRAGVRIQFNIRYRDQPQPSARLGQVDSGPFAVYADTPDKRLDACHEALNAALDHLASEAKTLGANAVIAVASYDPAGYLPAHPSFLCEQTNTLGDDSPAVVQRVRLVGAAVTLP
jgi:hypothetical protein